MNIHISTMALCCVVCLTACGSRPSADEAAITDTLMRMFDKPAARLTVGPIAVAGDAALADWTQGSTGGRALLRSRGGTWSIELCAGDGIKSELSLSMANVPPGHAREIVAELDEEERGESPERLKQIASFTGVVRMRGGQHPPADDEHGVHAPRSEQHH